MNTNGKKFTEMAMFKSAKNASYCSKMPETVKNCPKMHKTANNYLILPNFTVTERNYPKLNSVI